MNTEQRRKIALTNGDDLIKWYEHDLNALQSPDQIPDDDIANVKAYKMHLYWLEDKINTIKRLQKPEQEQAMDSYE